MAQELDHSFADRAGRWLKWRGLRVIQLAGFALVAIGAYPYLRPFLVSVTAPPAALDSFAATFFPVAGFGAVPIPTLRSVVFIVAGAVVIWISTAQRLH